MEPNIKITENFRQAAASFGQEGFTTKDFIDRYRSRNLIEWEVLVERYGPGGKGSGHPYSANSRVGSMLGVLFRSGDLHRFPYVTAPPEWGNPVIRRWAVSLKGSLADVLTVLGPADTTTKSDEKLPSWSDMEYREGTLRLRTHLRRERDSKLPTDKKKAFRSEHGKLFCERCKISPIDIYGEAVGESAIEVHHAGVMVKDMKLDHKLKLSDLQCLCANCHRVVHAELRMTSSENI